MKNEENDHDGIKTTERVFQTLESLVEADSPSFTEVADRPDLSRRSAYRHLTSL